MEITSCFKTILNRHWLNDVLTLKPCCDKFIMITNVAITGDDSCKISCHAAGTQWYAKRRISTDGSECINDRTSAFSKCVAGKCKVSKISVSVLSVNGIMGGSIRMFELSFTI